jgi:GTP-binding protein
MAVTPLVAIVGRPNVGKSSLFNRLVGRRQAITHETAGTTRDANYAPVSWNGKHFILVDTAGLEKQSGELEMRVQDQVREVSGWADLIIVVAEAGTIITNEDRQAARLALKSGKPVLLVLNKIDTVPQGQPADAFERLGITTITTTSAVHGRGTGDLLDIIVSQIEVGVEPTAEEGINLAILGRPNVGKSSLMNALVGKQQAIVSDVAGTTRDIGTATIRYHNAPIHLLDTAGLRRRGKIESGVEKYSALRTLAAIAQADICVVVMDASEPSVAGDQHIAGLVAEAGKGLILVMNKWDAVEKETGTQEFFTRRLVADFAFVHWAPLIYTSATQGLNITKLFEITQEIATRRETQVPTGELNRLIENMVAKQPPAGLKGKQPKIKYATQVAVNPPQFAIFASYASLVHFSYQRYLENGLRENFDFTGTPIKLEFRGK